MTPTDLPANDWPAPIRAAFEAPHLEPRGWQTSFAAQFIGLFLWVVYFDQLPSATLGRAGLLWPVAGLGLGGLLAYLLLYRAPALWGRRTGRPLAVVAARTFGVDGATWVPGLPLVLVQLVWIALGVRYGTDLGLWGLELLGLLDPRARQPVAVGGGGQLPGVVFLVTSLAWCVATVLSGRYLVRVIMALMNVYPIVPAVMLGVTAAVAMRGLPQYQAEVSGLGSRAGDAAAGLLALLTAAQIVFAFFSPSALASVDWGAVLRDERDVKAGGWVGVALASWVVGTLALISAAGAVPRLSPDPAASSGTLRVSDYAQALVSLIGGRTAGVMLIGFALTALAPACYGGFLLSDRLHPIAPKFSRTRWALIAIPAAWFLSISAVLARLEPVFGVIGAVFAPVAGAMTADFVRSHGAWTGARRGWNPAGLVGWAVGVAVGLVPVLGRAAGVDRLTRLQPAAVLGCLAAFVVYLVVAALGGLSIEQPVPAPAEPAGDAA